jgi:hypothetical protein
VRGGVPGPRRLLRAESRYVCWSRDIPSKDGILLDNRHLYITDDKGAIHALDKARRSVWKQDKLVTRSPSGPQLSGDYLAVVDYQGYVHVLDRNDGSLVGRVATDGSAATAQPVRAQRRDPVPDAKGGLFNVVRALMRAATKPRARLMPAVVDMIPPSSWSAAPMSASRRCSTG